MKSDDETDNFQINILNAIEQMQIVSLRNVHEATVRAGELRSRLTGQKPLITGPQEHQIMPDGALFRINKRARILKNKIAVLDQLIEELSNDLG